MIACFKTCLIILLIACKAMGQVTYAPYASFGGYFGYDFKGGKNDIRAQSRIHAGFIGHKSITKRFLVEGGIGYCKYQRHLFAKDSLYYPTEGYYDYTYRLHSVEALINTKFNVLYMSRGNNDYKLYPVVGIGATYAFAESKRPKGTRDVIYTPTKNFGQYFAYTFKAGLELEGGYQENASFSYGLFYQYNRFASNTLLDGDNHNIQLQARLAFNFEKKPKKIPMD